MAGKIILAIIIILFFITQAGRIKEYIKVIIDTWKDED